MNSKQKKAKSVDTIRNGVTRTQSRKNDKEQIQKLRNYSPPAPIFIALIIIGIIIIIGILNIAPFLYEHHSLENKYSVESISSNLSNTLNDSKPVEVSKISFSTGELIPKFAEDNNVYELTSLNSLNQIMVKIDCNEPCKTKINEVEYPANQENAIKFDSLNEEEFIKIKVFNDTGSSKEYFVRYLPSTFPKYTVKANSPKEGQVFFVAFDRRTKKTLDSFIIITDNYANPLFYKKDNTMSDFKKIYTKNGQEKYVYFSGGKVQFLDSNFNPTEKVSLLPTNKQEGDYYIDSHEIYFFDENDFVIVAYITKTVRAKVDNSEIEFQVKNAYVQEIKNGEAVWDWDSTDYPELYPLSIYADDYNKDTSAAPVDYLHMNSIEIDPLDDNFIFSFRHADLVIKVNRKNGKIIWMLGGKGDEFGLNEFQKFSQQHYAKFLPNGYLSIFDNGNTNEESRIVEVLLDQKSKTLLDFKVYYYENHYSSGRGSSQKLDENTYFIGWGTKRKIDSAITELNVVSGKMSFELSFLDEDYITYRAYKIK